MKPFLTILVLKEGIEKKICSKSLIEMSKNKNQRKAQIIVKL